MAKLEQERAGDAGAGICGVLAVPHLTGTGPDAVRVLQTGETLTEAAFRACHPRGTRILLPSLRRDAPTGGEAG